MTLKKSGNMKQLAFLMAAMTAVLASCTKVENLTPEVSDINVHVKVTELDAADTKAYVKTGWAENDCISIWYDANVTANPNLVIKYDGSKWTKDESATISYAMPAASGYVKAVYNGSVTVASKDNYTVSGDDFYVTLEHWSFLTEIQVVVTGLDASKADKYTLACNRFTPPGTGAFNVGAEAIQAAPGTKRAAVSGISNTDGVAFVFATTDSFDSAANYGFTLTDNTSGTPVVKQYVVPNKTIAGNASKIKGLKLASSSFSESTNYLSFNGNANTYIVSKSGSYCFDANVKGNGGLDPQTGIKATTLTGIAGVKVLWEINAQGKAIKYDGGYAISYSNGLVWFSTPDTFEAGAAYVGVVDASDNVLWSWLVWATDSPSTLTYSEGGKTWNYMDRNLGALSTSGYGFMYQWGRKDPFPTTGSSTFVPAMGTAFSHAHVNDIDATVAYAVAHPTTFIATSDGSGFDSKHNWLEESCNTLWTDSKTIYDPSPAGWKIPSYNDVVRTDDSSNSYFYHCYTNAGFGRWDKGYSAFHYGNAPGTGYCWTSTSREDYPQSAYYIRSSGQLTYVNAKSDGYVIRCIVDSDN